MVRAQRLVNVKLRCRGEALWQKGSTQEDTLQQNWPGQVEAELLQPPLLGLKKGAADPHICTAQTVALHVWTHVGFRFGHWQQAEQAELMDHGVVEQPFSAEPAVQV